MNWSSVKNLLIAILVAANLFIVYNIVRQDRVGRYLDEETVKEAAELLFDRGLAVDTDSVPLKKFDALVYESAYNDEYYTEVAQILAGADRELLLSLPSGGFSITAVNGAVVEFDSEFGFLYQRNDNFKEMAYIDITFDNITAIAENGDELKNSLRRTLEKKTESFLNSCFSSDHVPKTEVTASFCDSASGLNYVFALQKIDGYNVHSHYAICVYEGEEMTGAYGRWFFSGFRDTHSAQLTDQVNILFADLDTLKSELDGVYKRSAVTGEDEEPSNDQNAELASVDSMEACYVTYWNADKTSLYFIPAWQIGHSDGTVIVYNATNSTVYSKNQ